MTQEQLAALIGSHESHVGRYEKDQSFPTAPAIRKLAEIFNVSTDYLLFEQTEQADLSEINDEELITLFKAVNEMDDENKNFVKKFLQMTVNENKIKQMLK